MNIKPISKDEFNVQSHSNPDIWYKINLVTHSCSCLHYQLRLKFKGGSCKHYIDLLNHIKELESISGSVFKQIENEIKNKGNNVPWDDISNKYGDEVIEQMIQLQKLFRPKAGYLGVLE